MEELSEKQCQFCRRPTRLCGGEWCVKLKGPAMTEQRYKVPEGMLEAIQKVIFDFRNEYPVASKPNPVHETELIGEAVCRWLSEHPIVPTLEQAEYMYEGKNGLSHAATLQYCMTEWQRRMFLTSEPEIPEEVRDFHAWAEVYFGSHPELENIKDNFTKAYRRGKESR